MKHSAGVLRMELGADEPAVAGDFNDFHQSALGVGADAHHAILFVFVFVFVVKLISVAMTLADKWKVESGEWKVCCRSIGL